MRPQEADRAIHFDVDLDERGRSGDPSAQIMRRDHIGMRLRDCPDLLALIVRQLVVHQLEQRQARQPHRAVDDPHTDRRAKKGIQQRLVEKGAEKERDDDPDVQDLVAALVQFVGADRDRSCAPHDVALVEDETDCNPDREDHDRDASWRVCHSDRPN